jgi:biotin carboxyl carrier protein
MTTRYRVRPVDGSARPGDEPVVVEADAPGSDAAASVGGIRANRDGTTTVEVVVDGWRFEFEVEDAARADLRRRATRERDAAATSGPAEIRAIIPGRVAAVRVTAGDAVDAGAGLLVVEAMKMQNELRAPRAGTIERVAVSAGDTIEVGDLLVVLR